MAARHVNAIEAVRLTCPPTEPQRPYRLLEVGTGTGALAVELIKQAADCGRKWIQYFGIDFFEALTGPLYKRERLRGKRPPRAGDVRNLIQRRCRRPQLRLDVELFPGDSRALLAELSTGLPAMHLVLLLGGASPSTLASDWRYTAPLLRTSSLLLMDHYHPHRPDWGAFALVERIEAGAFELPAGLRYEVRHLCPADGAGDPQQEVHLVRVQLRAETP